MLLHTRIDPVWYGFEQRCQTARRLQPGQLLMQTYTFFGSDFGENQQILGFYWLVERTLAIQFEVWAVDTMP